MMDEARPALTFAFFPPLPSFELLSDDIADGQTLAMSQVADSMGYDGGNLSPHLRWSGAPAATKSYAITVHDPDAPTGSGFWHWVALEIPAHINELRTGASTDAALEAMGVVQLRNDAGTVGYVGAAPPGGPAHRYVTVVHALDVERLEVPRDAACAVAGFNLRFHAIARAQLVPEFAALQ